MTAQPAPQSIQSGMSQTQGMTANRMIQKLKGMLPASSTISVAIMPSDNDILTESYAKLVVTNTPNGLAFFVGELPLIPSTTVDALIQVLSLPGNKGFLNLPVRLLKQSDGFGMNINLDTSQMIISGPMNADGRIDDPIFNRYGLVNIMNNWTFGTLLFVDSGTGQ